VAVFGLICLPAHPRDVLGTAPDNRRRARARVAEMHLL